MARKPRCPTCKKEIEKSEFFPFCSERCKLVDLGRWIGEEYRISVDDKPSEAEPKDDKKTVH
jgi:endogenous inhibitor of DNA gyrase (YacG/DUF329 family)